MLILPNCNNRTTLQQMFRYRLVQSLFVLLGVFPSPGFGEIQDRFQKVDSPFMTLIRPDSPYAKEKISLYPSWAEPFLQDYLRYEPSTKGRVSTQCSFSKGGQHNFSLEVRDIQGHLQSCEEELDVGYGDIFSNTYRTMMLRLSPETHPMARYVLFHLPNGVRVKGFLGLKDSDRPRPLVILRAGIFSNVTEFLPERFLFLQLFEQSQFHFLILESSSGNEFIARNQKIAFGGFDEGIQNFQIARQLQNPKEPMSKYIHSVHLSGISMGGHSVFFSALLNEVNRDKNKKVFSSFLAFCPLVNMRDTFDYQLSQGVLPYIVSYWFQKRLPSAHLLLPQAKDKNFMQSLMDYLGAQYQGPLSYEQSIRLPDGMEKTLNKYWIENDFWKFSKKIETPFLIFATRKDPLVPFLLNSGRIQNKYLDLSDMVSVVELKRGYHCSLPGEYDMYQMADLYHYHILNQSQGYEPQYKEYDVELSVVLRAQSDLSYDFQWDGRSPTVFINFGKKKASGVKIELPTDSSGALLSYFQPMNKSILSRYLRQNLKLSPKGDRLKMRLFY
ncbi:MAG: hypothetical protein BroJett040_20570 [Oligoflexia bacterium]|nr:MAG: hypothetical protein BroJett040_20570 [Oligoflexia bacterium]